MKLENGHLQKKMDEHENTLNQKDKVIEYILEKMKKKHEKEEKEECDMTFFNPSKEVSFVENDLAEDSNKELVQQNNMYFSNENENDEEDEGIIITFGPGVTGPVL